MTEQAVQTVREEDLEAARRILEALRPLDPIQRTLLLGRSSHEEGRMELGRLRGMIADLLDASPTLLAILGMDPERLGRLREAVEVLLRAQADALALARALSANGLRVEQAERQIDRTLRALAARRGIGGWFELKFITVRGRRYGPYLYYRWREGGRKRSRYKGKGGIG